MANYKTSWVQRLIEGAWQKTFAFAHAKTVYTDYENKKTLADKLSEIDTEIGNKANKTEIPTELPANGGNSATVNGHTVKSDVPSDAKFTDTVYDDTEVQKRISDNGYGEVAGGKNFYNCGNEVGGINSDGDENTETNRVRSNGYIKVNSSTTYTASVKNKNIYLCIYLYDKEKKIISVFSWEKGDYTFTTTDITEYVRVTYRTDDDISVSDILEYQIEEGTTATEYEPYFQSNQMLMKEKADKSETTVNILNPTLETTTKNGVTCTNNGDGTYTLDGTASANTWFTIETGIVLDGTYKIIAFLTPTRNCYAYIGDTKQYFTDYDKPINTVNLANQPFVIQILSGKTLSNVIVKPMITTNLDATYDDFVPYTGDTGSLNGDVADIISTANFSHNIPRNVPKDITSYITDGTFYKRLNGTDGFELFEDIYVGDYIKMSRAITCPDSNDGTVGSQYVTIAGLDTMMNNGEDGKYVNYHHAVMVPGQGFKGIQHFGKHAMNATNTTEGGYAGSVMDKSVFGAVVTEGSTASGATINQQLYAEFGRHLKTTDELLSTSINATGTNRFGTANGCSNNWDWAMRQAVLMSEVEVYGSTVWSSSGYDTGNAKMQLPLFAHSRNAINDRSSWYWLKDVASSAFFCVCVDDGGAYYYGAGGTWLCVRPRFIIAA